MQSPGGICQVRPCDRAQFCPAGSDDGIHMVAFKNIFDSNGRNANRSAYVVLIRNLENVYVYSLLRIANFFGEELVLTCSTLADAARDFCTPLCAASAC